MVPGDECFALEEIMSGATNGELWVSLGFTSALEADDVLHVVSGDRGPGPGDPPEQEIYLERFDQLYATHEGVEGITVGAAQIKVRLTKKAARALAFRSGTVAFKRRRQLPGWSKAVRMFAAMSRVGCRITVLRPRANASRRRRTEHEP